MGGEGGGKGTLPAIQDSAHANAHGKQFTSYKGELVPTKNAPFSRGREVRVRVHCIQREISALSSQSVMTNHDST